MKEAKTAPDPMIPETLLGNRLPTKAFARNPTRGVRIIISK